MSCRRRSTRTLMYEATGRLDPEAFRAFERVSGGS